ncbi:MAG: sialidase family protein [Planctomycetota bacterium]|nr:sialidase family protein [Planctomycetota bacterium]
MWPTYLTALGLLVLSLAACAADNDVVLNLEPSRSNPRNSEGAFVTLKNGRVLFLYTQFYGGSGDASPARIAGVHSDDKGATWSVPQVAIENDGKQNVMSVSLLRLASGKIALLYLVKNGMTDCRPVFRLSNDEAQTWFPPRLAIAEPEYYVVNNDRLVQLRTGRLLIPAALHKNEGGRFNAHAQDCFFYSDDEGQTWREALARLDVPATVRAGLQEPGVVELADGSLLGWARTDAGAQYGFSSADQGVTWSEPKATEMQSPLSPASIKRLGDAKLLAIFNDHSGQFPFVKGKRVPLVSAISTDNGRSWISRKLLEDDKDGWYCYTAIHFVEDYVLLAYCAGDAKVGGLNRLRIRRVKRAWFE